jgi:hypothetical protein
LKIVLKEGVVFRKEGVRHASHELLDTIRGTSHGDKRVIVRNLLEVGPTGIEPLEQGIAMT